MGSTEGKEGCFRHVGQKESGLGTDFIMQKPAPNQTVRQNVQSTEKIVNQQLKNNEDNFKNNTAVQQKQHNVGKNMGLGIQASSVLKCVIAMESREPTRRPPAP